MTRAALQKPVGTLGVEAQAALAAVLAVFGSPNAAALFDDAMDAARPMLRTWVNNTARRRLWKLRTAFDAEAIRSEIAQAHGTRSEAARELIMFVTCRVLVADLAKALSQHFAQEAAYGAYVDPALVRALGRAKVAATSLVADNVLIAQLDATLESDKARLALQSTLESLAQAFERVAVTLEADRNARRSVIRKLGA